MRGGGGGWSPFSTTMNWWRVPQLLYVVWTKRATFCCGLMMTFSVPMFVVQTILLVLFILFYICIYAVVVRSQKGDNLVKLYRLWSLGAYMGAAPEASLLIMHLVFWMNMWQMFGCDHCWGRRKGVCCVDHGALIRNFGTSDAIFQLRLLLELL